MTVANDCRIIAIRYYVLAHCLIIVFLKPLISRSFERFLNQDERSCKTGVFWVRLPTF